MPCARQLQRAEAVIERVARLDQAGRQQEQEKQRRADQLRTHLRASARATRDGAEAPCPASSGGKRWAPRPSASVAATSSGSTTSGPTRPMITPAPKARHDEAERAPQPHPAIVERARADAADRHRLDQRHDRGPVDGEQRCWRAASARSRPPPRAAGRRASEPQASAMRMVRRPPSPVGGKADGRREQDAGEERRGEQHGDLVGIELPPIEPDRQIRQIAAHHQEQRGIEKAEPPSEGEARERAASAGSSMAVNEFASPSRLQFGRLPRITLALPPMPERAPYGTSPSQSSSAQARPCRILCRAGRPYCARARAAAGSSPNIPAATAPPRPSCCSNRSPGSKRR